MLYFVSGKMGDEKMDNYHDLVEGVRSAFDTGTVGSSFVIYEALVGDIYICDLYL